MALKQYNPTSPGRRTLVLIDRSELHKGRPEKSLVEGLTKTGGRGGGGRIAVRFRGGGAKRLYRKVDFKRRKFDVVGTVERIEYDPNRTAFIALIRYADGEAAYILAPQRLKAGDQVIAAERADVKPGNAMPLRAMPIGSIIHNIELKPLKGGQIARSAGAYAQLVGRDAGSDIGPDVVQHLGGKTAGHPHCSNFRTRFEANGHKGLKYGVAVDKGILPDF
jgi:large subunit ribosomal protein L2